MGSVCVLWPAPAMNQAGSGLRVAVVIAGVSLKTVRGWSVRRLG